ncbi:MAG: bifunctional nuclease domain-containing protein [Candidatus Binataceae bacterium]
MWLKPTTVRFAPFALIGLAISLAACSSAHHHRLAHDEIKVNVVRVSFDHQTDAHYVLLRDASGKRALPIIIGDSEARAIMLAMHGVRTGRPLTEELLSQVIEKTGNHVDRVVITALRGGIYYADIYLDDGRFKVDSRPSDAIALAMNTNAPIYAAASLLEPARPAANPPPGELPATAHHLGLTVQNLSAGAARYFKAAPLSGLLVADASGAAAGAGFKRGDIITRIGGQRVKTLGDFNNACDKIKGSKPITLSVRRDGHQRELIITPGPHPNG